MPVRFGPAGLGSVKNAESVLKEYSLLGFEACEIAFTYGVYISKKDDALRIGKTAKKLGITLSIHAPYWINLNSEDKEKIKKSAQRILKCCEIGTYLMAKKVIFHPGYYGKKGKEETYDSIKKEIIGIKKIMKEKKYTPYLAPETTGKLNVFGSIDEIFRLSKETKCSFCIDFAHILARYKEYKFKEVFRMFKEKDFHIHFSGIIYGDKGEKSHVKTPVSGLKELILEIPEEKEIIVINESPNTVEDSIEGLKLYKLLNP